MRLPLIILTVLAAFAIVVSGQGRNLSPASAGSGLSQLMTAMQQVKAANALFVERRYLSMLSRPIETSGRLSYFAPDKLRKQTLSPTAGLLIVDGGKLTIEEGPGGNSRTLSLEEYPQLGALVEAIRATLAGDLPSLRRYFDVSSHRRSGGLAAAT